ncbi:MAG TPA: monovalent cation:proton antiporter-2 (CPA2) family protein [Polyangiaceae bacterium]
MNAHDIASAHGIDLLQIVALLTAAVVAVPLFKRIGLGSVLGYLSAGLAVGPFGLRLFDDPESILHVAELGVVMFLFVIGLEMQPSRLWSLRHQILGLGVVQVGVCGLLLTGVGMAVGFSGPIAFVAGMGFVLTSTAIVFQLLEERGDTASPKGQRMVSILLLEDLAIVPLLATVAFIAPASAETAQHSRLAAVGVGVGAVVGLVIVGHFLLNPMFRLLAAARARELMTAAALLVVLGAALAMQLGGLSMAMGAFVAGVLLSGSSFRHQLEADIEPFRGILLGLFFLGVGMALDVSVIAKEWQIIGVLVAAYMLVKSTAIYVIARMFKAPHPEALERAVVMGQGGEFAFVLYGAAVATGIVDAALNAVLTATVILSMVLTPLALIGLKFVLPKPTQTVESVEVAEGLSGSVLLIGFGRFGQIVSQPLLRRGVDVSIIDNDVEMIQAAAKFGFKVYFGDGSRLDILHAAGAGRARVILVCMNGKEAALKTIELIKAEFPLATVLARAYDRGHAIAMIEKGVDYQMRETLESALRFGEAALRAVAVPEDEAAEILAEVRTLDAERLQLQVAGGFYAGTALIKGNMPVPTPLTQPSRSGRALNPETAAVLQEEEPLADRTSPVPRTEQE